MTYRSVDEQDAEIRRLFPDFRLTAHADWIGVWEGPVRPASKTYTIRIVYFRRRFFDGWYLSNHYVTVHVVDPLIGKIMRDGDDLPHMYWNDCALERMVNDALGDKLFGDSIVRLCVPAFEGKHSEVFVFKTPHHPDYKFDRFEPMVKVALATSAAPTYFRPLEHNGYTLVDGGVWANNPSMLAVIEALICFDIGRDQIDLLSLGCGEDPYIVSNAQMHLGGKFAWYDVIFAAMRLQSLSAINQARLLLGPPAVFRLDPAQNPKPILLDDWRRSVDELVPAARKAVDDQGERIAAVFLKEAALPYVPTPNPPSSKSTPVTR